MSENNIIEEIAQRPAEADKSVKHSHHHHHHSSGRHHHHSSGEHTHRSSHSSHHHSRHHSSHNSLHRTKKNNLLVKLKSFKRKIGKNLSITHIATKTSERKLGKYGSALSRLFFGLIVFGLFAIGAIMYYKAETTDTSLQNAQYTPSETSQLRRQVVSLEQEIEALEKELERYKQKFGELPEETAANEQQNATQ